MDSTTSKTKIPGCGTYHKMVTDDILFYLCPTFVPLPYGLKITRLRKLYMSTWKSYPSEGKFSPIWRNNIGNILLDAVADPPVWFAILKKYYLFQSNPSHGGYIFLVSLHWQVQCQARKRKRVYTTTKKFQAQRKK